MQTAAITALATLSFALAGAAFAGDRFNDVDYLQASRCKGIAAGRGSIDTANVDAVLKAQGPSRTTYIFQKGAQEMQKAKKDAAKSSLRDRVDAELAGPCVAWLGAGKDVAAR